MPDDSGGDAGTTTTAPGGTDTGATTTTATTDTKAPPATQATTQSGGHNEDELPESVRDVLRKERKARQDAERRATAAERKAMDDNERELAEARDAGKAEAREEFGITLAEEALRGALNGRVDDKKAGSLIEVANLKAFLTDEGKVDRVKVKTYVDAVAPSGTPDLGQGSRGAGGGTDMNQLIRDRMGR